jgi:hypothetical protein
MHILREKFAKIPIKEGPSSDFISPTGTCPSHSFADHAAKDPFAILPQSAAKNEE